ncbi:MAG: ImmA/IrrE family metallo-endopeptidase [Deltaproteobacteria bacterium]|nr:ImmA/IrrE family metallo-endopeptidase [Deltaproteobacteria bacterium]
MRFGDPQRFAWVVEPLGLSPEEAESSAARSLVRLQVWCAGQNLCSGVDEEGDFDTLEVPLIDLAVWLVKGWEERLFDASLQRVLATGFLHRVSVAARWEVSGALALGLADAESLHTWASVRALEFAGSDYLLPNVVFDRIDDFIRISWSQRSDRQSFVDVAFAQSKGTVLVDARDFVAVCMDLIRTTYELTKAVHITDDVRVVQLAEFLDRDPAVVGRRAVQRWVPGVDIDAIMAQEELVQLGKSGRGGVVAAFLRSSDQVLAARIVTRCLHRFGERTSQLDKGSLEALTAGADTSIDPAEPWASGLRLARHVRARFAEIGLCPVDGPVPITAVISDLGIAVALEDLGTTDADGVCLLDQEGRALAILNTGGRLSASAVGRRSTLAHELCHFAFDAPRFKTIGQADLRRSPDSIVEKRANAFAAELLLPRSLIRRYARGDTLHRSTLAYLAKRFGVGMQLAAHQAENAGIRLSS